jgi:hypothetical protein
MIGLSDLTSWINNLVGDYVEDWVSGHIAVAWMEDKQRIQELELRIDAVLNDNTYIANATKKPGMHDCYGINAVLLWQLKQAREVVDEHLSR